MGSKDLPAHGLSHKLLEEGHSVKEIARKRGIAESTVHSHFLRLAEEGKSIDLRQFVSQKEIEGLNKAKFELGNPEGLRPYFDFFDEKLSYEKIKMGLFLLNKRCVPRRSNRA
ncbi:helix-turn-helix domain-containing protein [Pricia sp. S334]|uniref:Helix-turn-helix domain-containing protein n=1 Tax=Pricia mediterranea TaxID=3076079 RepID=A0ABU3L4E4_9FLAO|nr:helix-turn-helix domain-containing protein [Pricia sp. S334]MDT7828611.1 helix-turn-helix domain-containing protein [Pricia sp. S334]